MAISIVINIKIIIIIIILIIIIAMVTATVIVLSLAIMNIVHCSVRCCCTRQSVINIILQVTVSVTGPANVIANDSHVNRATLAEH